jgi:hypothetical protein
MAGEEATGRGGTTGKREGQGAKKIGTYSVIYSLYYLWRHLWTRMP